MTIKDAIKLAGMIERGHGMDPELAIFLLSELDGMIQSDIMLYAPEEIVSYDNQEQELVLKKPHDGVYVSFLVAMIRQCQEEFEGYNNAQAIVNEKLEAFREWYVAHYDPAETASREYTGGTSADAFGFAYLTAYGLAVKHGYQGTEEEWLESLIGQPGEAARMRYDEDREVIQWGVGDTWYDMFPLSALRDPAVDDIVYKVQAAVDTARGHAHDAGVSSGEASAAATAASSAAAAAAQSAQTAGEHADSAKTEAQKASSAANAVGSAVVAAREQADRAEAARTAAERAEQVAGAAAVTATQEAGGAAQSARDAETYAGQAYTSSQQANKYAYEASQSAQSASAAQTAAETAVDDAQTQAVTAGNYAKAAEESAQRAEAAAGNAGGGSAGDIKNAIDSHNTDLAAHPYFHERCNDLEGALGDKLDASKLPEAINTALAQAQASGAFDGDDGITPHIGANGNWYIGSTDTGVRAKGRDGTDGHTPVRGVDYWTAADQEAIIQQVIAALGTPVFGRVDADNNIILSGELADGTYTIKYEDGEGNVTEIGTLNHVIVPAPTYVNQIPLSINADGSPYIGDNGEDGYRANYRINSSNQEVEAAGMGCTGYIPCTWADTLHFANIGMSGASTNVGNIKIFLYDSEFNFLSGLGVKGLYENKDDPHLTKYNVIFDSDGKLTLMAVTALEYWGYTPESKPVAYIRVTCEEINADSIITVNQKIETSGGNGADDSGLVTLEYKFNTKIDKTTGEETADSSGTYHTHQLIPYDSEYDYLVTLYTRNSYFISCAVCWYDAGGQFLGWNNTDGGGELKSQAAGSEFVPTSANVVPMENAASFKLRIYAGGFEANNGAYGSAMITVEKIKK